MATTVPVQIVRVADDDGQRQTHITPDQAQQWLNFANTVYASANIQFTFDPATDFSDVRSTLVNNMTGTGDANWDAERHAANQIAAGYPGKMTFLFRWGPGSAPTGGGFSWWDYSFTILPGFYDTGLCGGQNIKLLAHELGHHLGLPHTFGATFNTEAEAANYLAANGNNPAVFDGDGLADTPPDPGIASQQCPGTNQIVLNGVLFALPRSNIMSYYYEASALTPQQITRAQWMIQNYARNGMFTPSNQGVTNAIEAEGLSVLATSNAWTTVQPMAGFGADGWSGNAHVFCGIDGGGLVTFQFNASQAGWVRFDLYATQGPGFGAHQLYLDNQPLGAAVDSYAPVVLPSGRIPLTNIVITAGLHQMKIQSVGKNSLSSDYRFGFDAIALVPLVAPSITSLPQSQTIIGGTTVTLEVLAAGTTPLSYQWRRNSTNLAASGRISGVTAGGLNISNVLRGDAGSYSVVITNDAGAITSTPPAILTVFASKLAPPLRYPDGHVTLAAQGEIGTRFDLQSSTNLLQWNFLSSTTNLAGAFSLVDSNASPARRFYRLRAAP